MNSMRRLFVTGGVVSSLVLMGFGSASIVIGIDGRSEVRDSIAREQIVGTPDMKSIANEKVNTGEEAKAFADGIRKHTLAATGGKTYSEMDQFLTEDGTPTSDEAEAAKDPKSGRPVENEARNIWVTSTALSTALNTSFFAEQVSLFSIMTGVALLLAGVGFAVLTIGALRMPAQQLTVMPVRERAASPAGA